MTELSFLLELLLNHKLTSVTKTAIKERVKEVEANLSSGYHTPIRAVPPPSPGFIPPHLANQAPSTIAKLMQHPDLLAQMSQSQVVAEPIQPTVVAQTAAAQAAVNARQEAINVGISGKPEKGRTSPRKF